LYWNKNGEEKAVDFNAIGEFQITPLDASRLVVFSVSFDVK
jgi:hypothetical protein